MNISAKPFKIIKIANKQESLLPRKIPPMELSNLVDIQDKLFGHLLA